MALHRRRDWGAVAVTAVLLAGCANEGSPSATAESGDPGESAGAGECNITVNEDGSIEPLADGFPNQPFTIVSADDPGASDGIYGLGIKEAIDRLGLTDQRVTVVDRPDLGAQYGTWEALRFIGDQPGGDEGYLLAVGTVPGSTTDLIQTEVMENYGMDVESLNVLITSEFIPYVLVSRPDAPWGSSYEELIQYGLDNPDEPLRYISRGPGAGVDLAFTHYSMIAAQQAGLPEGEVAIPIEFIVGGSHQEINATVGAGEGDITNTIMETGVQFAEDGHTVILLFGGNAPAPEAYSDVPTARDVFGEDLPNDPWGQNRFLFAAEGIDECHHEWLVTMMEQVMADEEYQENRLQIPGLALTDVNREDTWEMARVAFDAACQILIQQDLVHETVIEAGHCEE